MLMILLSRESTVCGGFGQRKFPLSGTFGRLGRSSETNGTHVPILPIIILLNKNKTCSIEEINFILELSLDVNARKNRCCTDFFVNEIAVNLISCCKNLPCDDFAFS